MVAPGKIRCHIVEIPVAVPVSSVCLNERQSSSFSELMPKPSELVPWADPYIAGLVAKLQREVRDQRHVQWQATEVVDDKNISLYGRELADFELDAADVFAPATAESEWPWFNDDFNDDSPEDGSTRNWDDDSGEIPALV